jgi:(p)ppGpp synthase/HD superfamily hydrolase
MTKNSHRLSDALSVALDAHQGQMRKGTEIPYVSHVMGVAALVFEFGGTEDQAIAALLHDAIEDGGEEYSARIAEEFGSKVIGIVRGCTDGTAESKAAAATEESKRIDWKRRKDLYLIHLAEADEDTLLVSACDKLHNARSISSDLRIVGPTVFERFTTGREGTSWYYNEIVRILEDKKSPVATPLRQAVDAFESDMAL